MFLVLFIVSFMNGGVKCGVMSLSGGTADEEPLVYRAVDGLGREILVGGERRELRGANAAGGVLNVDVGAGVGIIVSRRPAQVATNEISERKEEEKKIGDTYVEISPAGALPVMSFSQASAHSRTTSMAYLKEIWLVHRTRSNNIPHIIGVITHFLFLHSPVKANWFSGLPSGIL